MMAGRSGCLLIVAAVIVTVTASPVRVRRQTAVYDNDFQWTGPWSKCSKTCGNGQTKRGFEQSDPTDPLSVLVGTFTASCNMLSCGPSTSFGPWEKCSKTCGGGTRRRLSTSGNLFQKINCGTQSCSAVSGCGKADVLFVLDSSGSVGELSWFSVKQFVIDVISNMKIESGDSRIGVVSFSTDVEVNFHLNKYSKLESMTDAVWAIPFKAGATNTAEALYRARTSMMVSAKGDRADVKNVVIVLTDGASNIFPAYTIKEATRIRNNKAEIFAIGVTNKINATELNLMASTPKSKHVFELADFEALKTITSAIVKGACVVPVDGGWTDWGVWTECNANCKKERKRTCTNPAPENNGKQCAGDSTEIASCNDGKCPVDGGWTDWGVWTECSADCKKERSRTCTKPAPKNGGKACTGDATETAPCNDGKCVIDGGWTDWGIWSTCKADCTKERKRTCTKPEPKNGGKVCDGLAVETLPCTDGQCVIDGGWTDWGIWTECRLDCTKERKRTCTKPAPQNGGTDCSGDGVETLPCSGGKCAVDGGWTDWGEWSECSANCEKERKRTCTDPAPANGGKECSGDSVEKVACTDGKCPDQVDCSKCEYVNKLGYMEDTKDCSKYYQCQDIGTGYIYHHKNCAAGTLWRQDYQTCVHPSNALCKDPTVVKTAAPTTAKPTVAPSTGICKMYGQTYESIPGKPNKYMVIWATGQREMPCAATLVWSQTECTCVFGTAPITPVCDQSLLLYYPFDKDVEDHSCGGAKSVTVGTVEFLAGKRSKAAYFNGECRIEVPRMMNAFADQKIQHFSIALWFKNVETVDVLGGLVNNGGCTSDPTFTLYSTSKDSISGGYHTSGVTVLDAFTGITVSHDTWHHLAMTYDGKSVRLYIDGKEGKSIARSGYILNSQCAMNIAYQGKDVNTKGFFKGYIDELRVYKKTLTVTDITTLMSLQ